MEAARSPSSGAPRRAVTLRGILLHAAALWAFAALAWLQFSTDHLVDRDSYYHARYAQLLPERGLSREFPWAQESVWRDSFSDKEFLYHVLLAGLCRGPMVVAGAKAASWLLACGVVAALLFIVVRQGVRWPWLWVALVPALGNHFLFRLQPARPQVLSVILLLLGVHALLAARWRWLGVVGFVYAWSYVAPHLLVAFAAIDAAARWAIDRRFEWRGLAWAAGGVTAGLMFHPYFPNDLSQWWIVNVQILSRAWGWGGDAALRFGAEFESVSPRSLAVSSTLVLICFLGAFLAAVFSRGPLSVRSRQLAAYATGGFLLYCMSARFIEYFAPLALLAAASVASDLWPTGAWSRPRLAAAGAAGIVFVALSALSLRDAHRAVTTLPGPDLAGACRWTRNNVPAGETIAHLDWSDFPQLFHFDPTHRYLVGLDPMFMYVRHPGRLRLIEEIRAGRRPLDPREVARTFGARYLVVRSKYRGIAEAALLSPAYEDEGGAVYRLVD